MSRVPADTVLLRLALAAAIAVPLSGCGGDEAPERASTPPAATTPQAPASTSTSPPTPTPTSPAAPGEAKAKDETAAEKGSSGKSTDAGQTEAPAPAADTPSSSKTSKKPASSKTAPPEAIAGDMKRVHDALKAEGFDPGPPLDSGQRAGALQISKDNTTILFFPSPLSAERSAAQYKKVFDGSPQSVTLNRTANRLYMLSLPKKPTGAQLEAYRKIRKIANGAV